MLTLDSLFYYCMTNKSRYTPMCEVAVCNGLIVVEKKVFSRIYSDNFSGIWAVTNGRN